MTEADDGMPNGQSETLLAELLERSLDERWRLFTERDLRLRRLNSRDFAVFCRELGIRPPAGLSVVGPEWALAKPVAVQPTRRQVLVHVPRRRNRFVRLAMAFMVLLVVGAQGYIVYRLSEEGGDGVLSVAPQPVAAAAAMAPALDKLRLELATEQLRGALAGGLPFDGALAVVTASPRIADPLLGDARALKPFAADGIPTAKRLRQEFDGIADAVTAGIDVSLPAVMCRGLSGLLVVDLCGASAVAQTRDAVERARAAVTLDDLAAAALVLDRLSNGAALTVAPWVAAVRARLIADRVTASLANGVAD